MGLDSVTSISGFGWSGSTAIRDFLREYDGVYHLTHESSTRYIEYSLLYDPNGFIDLFNKIVRNWNFLHVDKAIKDHVMYFNRISARESKFNPHGLNLNELCNVDSEQIHTEFLNEIIAFDYKLSSRVNNLYQHPAVNILTRFRNKIFPQLREKSYFSSVSEESFVKALALFHEKMFANIGIGKHILIEKMIPVNNIKLCSMLFPDIKVIIIDRDPRDTFVELVNRRTLFFGGNDVIKDKEVEQYCSWKEKMYVSGAVKDIPYGRNVKLGSMNILKLDFEDLVFRFQEVQLLLEEFLGISRHHHIDRLKYFNKENSLKNIGKWREYHNQDHIAIIEKLVPSYFSRIKTVDLA